MKKTLSPAKILTPAFGDVGPLCINVCPSLVRLVKRTLGVKRHFPYLTQRRDSRNQKISSHWAKNQWFKMLAIT